MPDEMTPAAPVIDENADWENDGDDFDYEGALVDPGADTEAVLHGEDGETPAPAPEQTPATDPAAPAQLTEAQQKRASIDAQVTEHLKQLGIVGEDGEYDEAKAAAYFKRGDNLHGSYASANHATREQMLANHRESQTLLNDTRGMVQREAQRLASRMVQQNGGSSFIMPPQPKDDGSYLSTLDPEGYKNFQRAIYETQLNDPLRAEMQREMTELRQVREQNHAFQRQATADRATDEGLSAAQTYWTENAPLGASPELQAQAMRIVEHKVASDQVARQNGDRSIAPYSSAVCVEAMVEQINILNGFGTAHGTAAAAAQHARNTGAPGEPVGPRAGIPPNGGGRQVPLDENYTLNTADDF